MNGKGVPLNEQIPQQIHGENRLNHLSQQGQLGQTSKTNLYVYTRNPGNNTTHTSYPAKNLRDTRQSYTVHCWPSGRPFQPQCWLTLRAIRINKRDMFPESPAQGLKQATSQGRQSNPSIFTFKGMIESQREQCVCWETSMRLAVFQPRAPRGIFRQLVMSSPLLPF